MRKQQKDALIRQVDELLASGMTLKQACVLVARQEEIADRPRVSAPAFVERQWASDQGPAPPSRVRAGRRKKQFVPMV